MGESSYREGYLTTVELNSRAVSPRAKRVKIFQPATLVFEKEVRRIHLLDVSPAGLRAHAQEPIPKGAHVRIECFDVVRNAVVMWSDNKRFGLMLKQHLTTEEISTLTHRRPQGCRGLHSA